MRRLGILWLLLCSGLAAVSAADWPCWRGPGRDGIIADTNWSAAWGTNGPAVLWRAQAGTGFSSVSVAQGRAFTLGNRTNVDTVYAWNATNGQQLWSQSYACPLDPKYYEGGPGASPTVEDGRVYTLSKRGHLCCFEAATGRVCWQTNLGEGLKAERPLWGFAGSPVVAGDLLLLNLGGAGTAVRKASGQVAWTSGTDMASYATPVLFGAGASRAAAIYAAKALVAVRPSDGRVLWRIPWEEKWKINAADPIFLGPQVFVSTYARGAALYQWDAPTPRLIWASTNMANHFNSCVLRDGFLYGIHGNTDAPHRDLRCVEAATGHVRWTQAGFGLGSLIAAGHRLLVLGDQGDLAVIEATPKECRPLARARVLTGKCWTPPSLAHGRLYVRNAAGEVACLDLRP